MSFFLSPLPSRARRTSTRLWHFLAVLVVGACATVGPSQPVADWPTRPVERSIQPGEVHSYPIHLEEGQFLHVFVEQHGADVAVRLFGDGGEEIVRLADGPHGPQGEEELAAIAKRSGSYLIEVFVGDQNATGKYRLRIDKPRPAEKPDHWRVEALRYTQEAVNLMGKCCLPKQAELRVHALRLWESLKDRKWTAETLHQLGDVHYRLRQFDRAAEELHRAAALWRELGHRKRLGVALNEAGRTARQLDRLEEAKDLYEEALAIAREVGNKKLEIDGVINLGRLHTALGEAPSAIGSLREALRLAKEEKNSEAEISALINLGSAYEELGEREAALDHYLQALHLAQVLADHESQATVFNNLGATYQSLGAWDDAIEHFEQALVLNRELGLRDKEAATLNNLGVVHERLGQLPKAYSLEQEALEKAVENEDEDLQATILTNLAYLDLSDNRPAEALERCQQALAIAQEHKGQLASTLLALGTAYRRLGDTAQAGEALQKALSQERQENRKAGIKLELARLRRDEGDLQGAIALAEEAIDRIELIRSGVVDQDLRTLFLASKQSYYEFYIDTLMELHRLDAQAGYAAQAFEQSERARARGLLDILVEAVAGIRQGADAGLLDKERELRGEINALDRYRQDLLRDGASERKMAEATKRLEEAIDRYKRIESELKVSSPAYWALTRPEPLSLEQIQNEVVGDALLLEYALGEERSYLWAVTADSMAGFELPPRSEIEAAARRFYELLTARNRVVEGESPVQRGLRFIQADEEASRAAAELSRMILKPAAPLLGKRPLLVVSDGALQFVPFSALPLPSSLARGRDPVPLIEHHWVVSLPSASVLTVLRDDGVSFRKTAPKTLAALGRPVFRDNDPRIPKPGRNQKEIREKIAAANPRGPGRFERTPDISRLRDLPYSEIEAEAITSLVPPDQRLKAVGFEATLDLATGGELRQYRFVHFATHGIVDSEQPELSSLVLSMFNIRGEEQDGLLRLPEVYNLQLNADLVVLSACETALGQEIRGEGLIGLTRGFMYAGAARVLASLWSIEDRPTAVLMERFYHGLLVEKLSVPEALRRAQREIAREKKWRSPYYWAGFSLQGEFR